LDDNVQYWMTLFWIW